MRLLSAFVVCLMAYFSFSFFAPAGQGNMPTCSFDLQIEAERFSIKLIISHIYKFIFIKFIDKPAGILYDEVALTI